jgi:hypothetical protein
LTAGRADHVDTRISRRKSKKPVRAKERWATIPVDADISGKNGWNPKHFWAFVVWNFDTKMVERYPDDKLNCNGRADPFGRVGRPAALQHNRHRKGEALETEYSVGPSPAKETPAEIIQAYKEKPINLEAFFTGGNPFEEEVRRDA